MEKISEEIQYTAKLERIKWVVSPFEFKFKGWKKLQDEFRREIGQIK